jgi:hypothetical protein
MVYNAMSVYDYEHKRSDDFEEHLSTRIHEISAYGTT